MNTGATESVPPVSDEDQGRAAMYALIARLFYAGPDAELLAAIGAAGDLAGKDETAPLATAWASLRAAAVSHAAAAREEYDQVFVGTGKAEITPYASHYLAESKQERVLLRLRETLAEIGLAKDPDAAEYEDHFSALCEVMRHLIAAGSENAALQEQKRFFVEYIDSWYAELCATVTASPNTNFYKHAAVFTKAFLDVEGRSFDLI